LLLPALPDYDPVIAGCIPGVGGQSLSGIVHLCPFVSREIVFCGVV